MVKTDPIPGPLTLARAVHRGPPPPTALIRMLCKFGVEIAFREIVRRLLPEEADAILAPGRNRRDREAERAYAFCAGIERRYFPIYEWEEIEGLVYCVPFRRMGWSYDDFHELDRSPGILLLRVLCAEPYESNVGARVPLLEAVEALGVPRKVLERVPPDGISPAQLHKALDLTPHAAAAEFSFDIVFWPRLILGNGPPVVRARPTLPTSNGRLEVGCAGEERRWICSRSYAANTSSG